MSKQSNQRYRKEMDKNSYKDLSNKESNSYKNVSHQKQSGHGNFNALSNTSNKTK